VISSFHRLTGDGLTFEVFPIAKLPTNITLRHDVRYDAAPLSRFDFA
jgi:hypothetical protein